MITKKKTEAVNAEEIASVCTAMSNLIGVHYLGVSSRPFMSVYYPERAAILPAGTVIEKGVRPLDGHPGQNRTAVHSIEYPGSGTRSIS